MNSVGSNRNDFPAFEGTILGKYEIVSCSVAEVDGVKNGDCTMQLLYNNLAYSMNCHWNDGFISGSVSVYKGADSTGILVLECEMVKSVLEGKVRLFNEETGKLQTEGTMTNNCWQGQVIEYSEVREILRKTEYVDGKKHGLCEEKETKTLWINNECTTRHVDYEMDERASGRKVMIEYEESSGKVVYRGDFNKSTFKWEGRGVEYDSLTDSELWECEYVDGNILRVSKLFWRGHMDEFDDDGNCIYQGLYCGDFYSLFLRHMMGVEYRYGEDSCVNNVGCSDESLTHQPLTHQSLTHQSLTHQPLTVKTIFGEWDHGVLVVDVKLLQQQSNTLCSEFETLQNELEMQRAENTRLKRDIEEISNRMLDSVIELNVKKNEESVTLSNIRKDLSRVTESKDEFYRKYKECKRASSTNLSTSNHSLSKCIGAITGKLEVKSSHQEDLLDSLSLTHFTDIRSIVVNAKVGSLTHTVTLDDLPSLQSLKFSDNCFTQCSWRRNEVNTTGPFSDTSSTRILRQKRSLTISNCPNLTSILIGFHSFADFMAMSLCNLPQLNSLSVGQRTSSVSERVGEDSVDSSSDNFCWMTSFSLNNLPSLSSVEIIGDNAFCKTSSCVFSNLPSLKTILIRGKSVFLRVSSVILENLPCLVTMSVSSFQAFACARELILANLNSLQSFSVTGEKAFCVVKCLVLRHLPQLVNMDLSGRACLKAANEEYKGIISLSDIPKLQSVKFGEHPKGGSALYGFKVIKSGKNVNPKLVECLSTHLRSNGYYCESLVLI